MRAVDLILKKREGHALTKKEIVYLVNDYTQGKIPDYQMAAFCMAVFFQGMAKEEIVNLTMAMVNSGEKMDLANLPGLKVDKHSTGGVADSTTLILAPLVAAAGVPVAKMSGRGLGHTGGTLDKLESIPGFSTALLKDDFLKQVEKINLAIAGQSKDLVPVDRKMYGLRDVTGTVDSLPLIAASIMSKKIAAGADKIVLDVKYGRGAFLKTRETALKLGEIMVEIGEKVSRETIAIITNMNQPLGMAVGNALEVKEALLVLQNKKRGLLRDLCLYLGTNMLILVNRVRNFKEGYHLLEELLENGKALEKFAQMVSEQGGHPQVINDFSLLPQAKNQYVLKASRTGYLGKLDALILGQTAMLLGAGRSTKESSIDLAVGLEIHVPFAESIKKGDPLLTIHYNQQEKLAVVLKQLATAIEIVEFPPVKEPLLGARITKAGTELLF
jgi:pyrimidine-nucleoside phosphorylase